MITNKTIANRRELLGISNESDIHSSMIEYTTASLKRITKEKVTISDAITICAGAVRYLSNSDQIEYEQLFNENSTVEGLDQWRIMADYLINHIK
ncbi:MAG: hypothetical protein J6V44_16080 [Methanobrevibacter sp.]|nr:hypothetical protein [Methanobrevibacter sp.]